MTERLLTIFMSITMLFPGAAVVDLFARHERQMEARRADLYEVVENEAVDPAEPLKGIGREFPEAAEGIGREVKEPFYEATEGELEAVAALVYLEAGGESEECQRAVTEVIFNRLASGIWGETLTEVIYAPGEFEPAPYIAETVPTQEIRAIVREVYENGSSLEENVLFFRSGYYHGWDGAVAEFAIGKMFFSSSKWCEV